MGRWSPSTPLPSPLPSLSPSHLLSSRPRHPFFATARQWQFAQDVRPPSRVNTHPSKLYQALSSNDGRRILSFVSTHALLAKSEVGVAPVTTHALSFSRPARYWTRAIFCGKEESSLIGPISLSCLTERLPLEAYGPQRRVRGGGGRGKGERWRGRGRLSYRRGGCIYTALPLLWFPFSLLTSKQKRQKNKKGGESVCIAGTRVRVRCVFSKGCRLWQSDSGLRTGWTPGLVGYIWPLAAGL